MVPCRSGTSGGGGDGGGSSGAASMCEVGEWVVCVTSRIDGVSIDRGISSIRTEPCEQPVSCQ